MLARAFDASNTPYLTPAGDGSHTVAPLEADVFPHHVDGIPPGIVGGGKYELRFAWSRQDLHAVQALRYRVFYGEMQARPSAEVERRQRDFDRFDAVCDHLLVIDHSRNAPHGVVVGTYRVLSPESARRAGGCYSEGEFDLARLQPGLAQRDGSQKVG